MPLLTRRRTLFRQNAAPMMEVGCKMEDFYTLFAREMKRRRVELGDTAERFAEKVAISPRHLRAIESGSRRPGLNLLLRIARALHISLDALLYASPDPPIPEKRNLLCAVLALDEAETHFLWSVVWELQRRRTQSE